MSALSPVDNYCERIDAGLWSEPLNAVTNIAFFIAAWLLYREYKKLGTPDRPALTLIALVAVIGLGSLLFHTLANPLTMMADVLPIIVFVYYFLFLTLRRLLACSMAKVFVALMVFMFCAFFLTSLPREYSFNGSASYTICLAALLILGGALRSRGHQAARVFFAVSALFAVSLTFRTLDLMLCDALRAGTHFLWHMLNGVVLYLLVRVMLAYPSKTLHH